MELKTPVPGSQTEEALLAIYRRGEITQLELGKRIGSRRLRDCRATFETYGVILTGDKLSLPYHLRRHFALQQDSRAKKQAAATPPAYHNIWTSELPTDTAARNRMGAA